MPLQEKECAPLWSILAPGHRITVPRHTHCFPPKESEKPVALILESKRQVTKMEYTHDLLSKALTGESTLPRHLRQKPLSPHHVV